MTSLCVGAAALNQIPLAWEHNRNNIIQAIKEAQSRNVDVLCLPELCITGYGCEDEFLSENTLNQALKCLFEIVPNTKGIAVAVGLPLRYENNIYNTSCFIVDGVIQGFCAKQNLARFGVHYEPRWFNPWPSGLKAQIDIDMSIVVDTNNNTDNNANKTEQAKTVFPLGDIVFKLNDLIIGFEICEDAWVEERIGYSLSKRKVQLILNPSASHFAFGKSELRKGFVIEGSRLFNVGYIYSNLLGNEAGRLIYDGDTLIAANGVLLASGPRFSFHEFLLTTAIINFKANDGNILTRKQDKNLNNHSNSWEHSPYLKEEEFTRAVTLGLFDYLRKSKAQGFVMNLSGGADSSAVACLVYLMVELAITELGKNNFIQKLKSISFLQEASKALNVNLKNSTFIQEVMKQVLFCLYQGTVNNSAETRESAIELSKALNCSFSELEIDPLVQMYEQGISKIVGRPLTWEKDNIALQNVQARVRSPSVWLLANLRHAILLCTSNRSEASTGYATMDGDTSGGLCPLLGVDKKFIIQWLEWLSKKGTKEIGPISALNAVLKLTPSAELTPLEHKQSDETDLMPFEWLDKIERAFLFDKLSPTQILQLLISEYPQEPPERLAKAIERFYKLWSVSQWKRERYAPSFHLDDESVDPKTWCRFPILSEGFSKELEEMWG